MEPLHQNLWTQVSQEKSEIKNSSNNFEGEEVFSVFLLHNCIQGIRSAKVADVKQVLDLFLQVKRIVSVRL